MFKTNGKVSCCNQEIIPQFVHYETSILEIWNCPRCGQLRQQAFPKAYIGNPNTHGGHCADGNSAVLRGNTKGFIKQSMQVEA